MIRPTRSTWTVLALLPMLPLALGADTCTSGTQFVSMRDGTQLATDVKSISRQTPPTILMRTPYGRSGLRSLSSVFNDSGYAAVAQDMRGFGDSEGEFMMFTDDGWGTRQDGYDTVQWIAKNTWTNGNVCMYGASALAISSLLAAGSAPPNLRCVFALVGSGDLFQGVSYWGGALREEMVVNWLTGLGELASLDAIEANPLDGPFWDPVSLHDQASAVNVPIYSTGGWYDIFSQGNLNVFTDVEAGGAPGGRGTQKLVMGPWSHASGGPTVGELTFPANSTLPGGEELRWFDHWLKNAPNGIESEAPVRYYLMGDVDTASPEWNVWKETDFWPVTSSPTVYYLHQDGVLSTEPQTTREVTGTSYLFDPLDPVPTVGGNNLTLASGPFDQRGVETRGDVLLYQTPILTAPVAITGRVKARLWVSSSAPDTDFTVKLTDVYPDGRSMLVLDGIARMRYREGFEQEVLMTPGQAYEVEVDLWSTALVFNAGHRIRVAVSSSNSPRFAVNPNDGGPQYVENPSYVVATQTLYHDSSHLSRLILPVVPLQ